MTQQRLSEEVIQLLTILKAETQKEIAESILKLVEFETQSNSVGVFFLETDSKLFRYFSELPLNPDWPRHLELSTKQLQEVSIPNFLTLSKHDPNDKKTFFFPILRRAEVASFPHGVPIGLIGFKNLSNNFILSDLNLDKLVSIGAPLNRAYDKRFLNNLLENINEPIDYTLDYKSFITALMDQAALATLFPMIALREYNQKFDQLLTLSYFGFASPPPSMEGAMIPDEFRLALNSNNPIQSGRKKWMDSDSQLQNIQQFIIIPIEVGAEIWGTLSVAIEMPYYFSRTESLGLQTLGHAVGVSITNYRNYQSSKVQVTQLAEAMALISGLDVAQAVRHQIRNVVYEMRSTLNNLVPSKGVVDKSKLVKNKAYLMESVDEISASLNKIRSATRPPKKHLSKFSLAELFKEATSFISKSTEGRNDIKINISGNAEIIGYREWLINAFENLSRNSLDAFKERKIIPKKHIDIKIENVCGQEDKVYITYTDNAGGIDVAHLEYPDGIPEEVQANIRQAVFERNVSSKGAKGSGWGLYITRLVIQDFHGGAISLRDYRKGVTFSISLPCNRTT